MDDAIKLVPDLEVELIFRPFELDPTIPVEGVDYKAHMKEKFGSDAGKDRANAMRQALIDYGEAEGIPYRFDQITRRPNSFNAHRLVRWAQGQQKGAEAKEALFKAYFSDGRDIGETDVLVDIAREIDLDPGIVAELLSTDADVQNVRNEEALFQQMGISGVPTYIANRRVAVQGAETAEKLARFLRDAAARLPEERPAEG
jgi:predicted DsbA family dithiol-disulfide isomerase